MVRKYLIHFDTLDPYKADPNLEKALDDIHACRLAHPDFEFSFELILDRFIVDSLLNDMFSAFVQDSFSEDSLFRNLWKMEDPAFHYLLCKDLCQAPL